MHIGMNQEVIDFIARNPQRFSYVYNLVADIQRLLEPSYKKGEINIIKGNENMLMYVDTKRYISQEGITDIKHQIEDIMENYESDNMLYFINQNRNL